MATASSDRNDGPLGKAPDISVGASDRLLLGVSAIGFGMMAYLVYNILLSKVKSAREMRDEERERQITFEERLTRADVSTLTRAQRRARARVIMKQQRRMMGNNTGLEALMMLEDDPVDRDHLLQEQPEEDDVPPFEEDTYHTTSLRHLSRKERQKAAKQIELQERRVLEDERRSEQQEAQQKEQMRKRERERQMALQREDESKKRQEDLAIKELLAYQAWRIFLPRPKVGAADEKDLPKGYISVKQWKEELSKNPIVKISDLARRFWISKQEVRGRIAELLKTDRITGVLESDRFLYLSERDFSTLSAFIKLKDKFTTKDVQQEIYRLLSERQR
jgi:predicted DNA-binding transcriptional regulator